MSEQKSVEFGNGGNQVGVGVEDELSNGFVENFLAAHNVRQAREVFNDLFIPASVNLTVEERELIFKRILELRGRIR